MCVVSQVGPSGSLYLGEGKNMQLTHSPLKAFKRWGGLRDCLSQTLIAPLKKKKKTF